MLLVRGQRHELTLLALRAKNVRNSEVDSNTEFSRRLGIRDVDANNQCDRDDPYMGLDLSEVWLQY